MKVPIQRQRHLFDVFNIEEFSNIGRKYHPEVYIKEGALACNFTSTELHHVNFLIFSENMF